MLKDFVEIHSADVPHSFSFNKDLLNRFHMSYIKIYAENERMTKIQFLISGISKSNGENTYR